MVTVCCLGYFLPLPIQAQDHYYLHISHPDSYFINLPDDQMQTTIPRPQWLHRSKLPAIGISTFSIHFARHVSLLYVPFVVGQPTYMSCCFGLFDRSIHHCVSLLHMTSSIFSILLNISQHIALTLNKHRHVCKQLMEFLFTYTYWILYFPSRKCYH